MLRDIRGDKADILIPKYNTQNVKLDHVAGHLTMCLVIDNQPGIRR